MCCRIPGRAPVEYITQVKFKEHPVLSNGGWFPSCPLPFLLFYIVNYHTASMVKLTCAEIIETIKSLENRHNVEGMARFGINPENNYGVMVKDLREMAKEIGKDHDLAMELWNTGIHDARILAPLIVDVKHITEEQMESWVGDFDSWDVCDNCCGIFAYTDMAYSKAEEWSRRDEEFVKRAGFVLMARLAVMDKMALDAKFEYFLPMIRREAKDERNYVKKAVNWALRSIGKRNLTLNKKAIKLSRELKVRKSKSARWIGSDALRELESEKVQKRFKEK